MGPLLFFGLAHALSEFPSEVSEHLDMPCLPSCLLCHDTPAGGSQTANQPFALALVAEGHVFFDADTLGPALDGVRDGDYDSDGDGRNDVDELLVGANPNPAGVDFCAVEGPPEVTRGCFADAGVAGAAGFGAWAWASRRRTVAGRRRA